MKNIINHELFSEAIKFVIVGVFNTIHYYLWYLLFTEILEFYYLLGHIIAFLISMVGSFYLNSYFTYRTKPSWKKFFRFPLTYLVNITVSTSALYVLREFFHLNNKIAPLLAAGLAIPFTFLIS